MATCATERWRLAISLARNTLPLHRYVLALRSARIRGVSFTRPRRFGKSTMMSMLKAFFEYRPDCDGKPVDNRHYFEQLKVLQDDEAMAQP